MAEKTYRSPGFFDYEIDLAAESTTSKAVPLGVIGAAEYEGRTVFVITMGHMWKNSRGAKVGDSTRPRAAQSLIRTAYSLLDREAEIVSERVQTQTQAQNQTPEQQLPVLPNIY